MTRATNARLAGYTFLIYIAVGITSMALTARACDHAVAELKRGNL